MSPARVSVGAVYKPFECTLNHGGNSRCFVRLQPGCTLCALSPPPEKGVAFFLQVRVHAHIVVRVYARVCARCSWEHSSAKEHSRSNSLFSLCSSGNTHTQTHPPTLHLGPLFGTPGGWFGEFCVNGVIAHAKTIRSRRWQRRQQNSSSHLHVYV